MNSPGSAEEAAGFSLGDLAGEVAPGCAPRDLEVAVRHLVDPASALETLHWGRNYLYRARYETAEAGPVDVVVKQFRSLGWAERQRRRFSGSKAARSWRAATGFTAAGLPTAEPVMLVESTRFGGPSYFVTRHLGEVVEARYLFRAANEGRLEEDFPGLDFESFLRRLAKLLARMHEAEIWHRDLSIGNVLLRGVGSSPEPDLFVIDLNRARFGKPLTASERTRDLCRLSIFRPEHQEAFLRAYWGDDPSLLAARRRLYLAYHRGFLRKVETKKKVRGGLRGALDVFRPRTAHAHIPEAPAGASARDKIVWDKLSDQPHQHASRWEKLRVRLGDLGGHARTAATVAVAAPGIWRRCRRLGKRLYTEPVPFEGMGVCLRPWPENPEGLLGEVEALGVRRLLLRLHPWQEEHEAEEELAAELHRRGYELAFALPQSRELVRDPPRWRAAVEELAERFCPFGGTFQVGQAINRSKWGVWSYGEYVALATAAAEVLHGRGAEVLGPAVIDFEYHAAVAVLNRRAPGLHFDAVSALLYVDRRGAPENRQAGLDTVDKVVLLKAIAQGAKNATGRCWITEFNWPLWEGPHSPAGRDVSVDEESQASYLARYFLLALGTGLVERVYWWQLAAKGYGLVDPLAAGGPRRRPSFEAMRTLHARLEGSRFLGPLPAPPGAFLYRFEAGGRTVVAGWSLERQTRATLPSPPEAACGRGGECLPAPAGTEVELGPAPVYFDLGPVT